MSARKVWHRTLLAIAIRSSEDWYLWPESSQHSLRKSIGSSASTSAARGLRSRGRSPAGAKRAAL